MNNVAKHERTESPDLYMVYNLVRSLFASYGMLNPAIKIGRLRCFDTGVDDYGLYFL